MRQTTGVRRTTRHRNGGIRRWRYWIIAGAVVLALAALVGWGSAYTPLMVPRASEEWSRGRVVGTTPVNLPGDMQLAPGEADDGRLGVFLSWVDLDDRIHLAQVGARGQVLADRTPALQADTPREPRFLVSPGVETQDLASRGKIHLIWRETGGGRSLLMYAGLMGARSPHSYSVQVGPFPLSQAGDEAQSAALAFNRSGGVEVVWVGQAGVYWVSLGDPLSATVDDQTPAQPVLLVEGGEEVSVRVDQMGVFHLAWQEAVGAREQVIYYATLDPELGQLSQPELIDTVFLRTGQTLQSLGVGVDSSNGYVLWVIQDMKYVTSNAQYAFFPVEIPRQKKVRDLQLSGAADPLGLWVVPGQYETLLVALTETVLGPDGPQLQIGLVALSGEQPSGQQALARARPRGLAAGAGLIYQSTNPQTTSTMPANAPNQRGWPEDQYVVTGSDRPSLKPVLRVDEQGDLHLTWLETGGFGAYRVAYASTTAEVRKAYNAVNLWDVTDRALGTAMQFFLAVGLTPVLAITWSLFPLMWLLGYHLISGHETLATLGERAALAVAVLLEVVFTYLVNPYRNSMPAILQWTAPVATAAVALLVTLVYVRRRGGESLFGAFFLFAPIHGLLQVMLFVLLSR